MPVGPSILSKLQPAIIKYGDQTVHQYRGVPYGTVSRRFAEPEAVSLDQLPTKLDYSHFGYTSTPTKPHYYTG